MLIGGGVGDLAIPSFSVSRVEIDGEHVRSERTCKRGHRAQLGADFSPALLLVHHGRATPLQLGCFPPDDTRRTPPLAHSRQLFGHAGTAGGPGSPGHGAARSSRDRLVAVLAPINAQQRGRSDSGNSAGLEVAIAVSLAAGGSRTTRGADRQADDRYSAIPSMTTAEREGAGGVRVHSVP